MMRNISELAFVVEKNWSNLLFRVLVTNEEKKTQKRRHAAKTKRAFKAALFVGEYGIRRRRWGLGRDARSSTVWVFFVSSPSLCLLRSFGLFLSKRERSWF